MEEKENRYRKALHDAVVKNSTRDNWEEAVLEYKMVNYYEIGDGTCVCGQPHIRHAFVLKNVNTHRMLDPIGSDCVMKFGREDLSKEIKLIAELRKFKDKLDNGAFIKLTPDFFSKNLISFFRAVGCLKATEEDFLLKMFRMQKEPTVNQQRYINAMIMKIRNFMQKNTFEDYIAFIEKMNQINAGKKGTRNGYNR